MAFFLSVPIHFLHRLRADKQYFSSGLGSSKVLVLGTWYLVSKSEYLVLTCTWSSEKMKVLGTYLYLMQKYLVLGPSTSSTFFKICHFNANSLWNQLIYCLAGLQSESEWNQNSVESESGWNQNSVESEFSAWVVSDSEWNQNQSRFKTKLSK